MSQPFRLDPAAACDACGCHGAFRFDGENLCVDCYAGRGSCCSPGFSDVARKTPVASACPPTGKTDCDV